MNLFEIQDTAFDGEVKVIRPTTFPDNRGSLTLTRLQSDPFCSPTCFILRQMFTRSEANVIRGLHFQLDPPMGKLLQVINGSAWLVAVDIRPESPTFLKYHSVVATDSNNFQVWAPAGFARGYYTFEPNTIVLYNCDEYVGEDQAIRWDDQTIGIDWPTRSDRSPILSERDSHAQSVQSYIQESYKL
jgi:dTDP-4-dehydrorhamnose 3,5-epimerase